MPYKFNPFTNRLDFYEAAGGGVLPPSGGGTGISTYATGDILYASAANTLSKLPIGAAGEVLTVTAGLPAWEPAGAGTSVAFDVYLSGNIGGVTGDGTVYPIIYDTVNFDTNSAYNTGTGLYTFPVTGIYQMTVKTFVYVSSGTSTSTLILSQTTGTLADRFVDADPNALGLTTNLEFITCNTFLYNATAGDTMGVSIQLVGGTKNIGAAGAFVGCHFSGAKVA